MSACRSRSMGRIWKLNVLSQAMYTRPRRWRLAGWRRRRTRSQADGIVGVRLTITQYEWGGGPAGVLAIGHGGTARAIAAATPRPQHGRPFSSDLSGQDLWKSRQAGYRPVRLAMGTCVYHVAHQTFRADVEQGVPQRGDGELHAGDIRGARTGDGPDGGRGAAGGRRRGSSACGLRRRAGGWGSHIIEFFAVGTAVIRVRAPRARPHPTMTLPSSAITDERSANT